MPIIAVVNTKGGVGKTTSAIYLAAAAAYEGHDVRVVDADPQASATTWIESVGNATCELVIANAVTLARLPEDGVTIIDTPPGNPAVIDRAIEVADFVVIPTAPSLTDISRVWETMSAIDGKPAAVLLTQVNPQASLTAQARDVLEEAGHFVFPTNIPRRESFRQAFGTWPSDDTRQLLGYDTAFRQIMEVLS